MVMVVAAGVVTAQQVVTVAAVAPEVVVAVAGAVAMAVETATAAAKEAGAGGDARERVFINCLHPLSARRDVGHHA
jgi:hypothetical protein